MLRKLQNTPHVVGLKQLRRALGERRVTGVILAENAEARVLNPVIEACRQQNIPIQWIPTMAELGKACRIEVGAAAVGLLAAPEKI